MRGFGTLPCAFLERKLILWALAHQQYKYIASLWIQNTKIKVFATQCDFSFLLGIRGSMTNMIPYHSYRYEIQKLKHSPWPCYQREVVRWWFFRLARGVQLSHYATKVTKCETRQILQSLFNLLSVIFWKHDQMILLNVSLAFLDTECT